MTLAQPLKAGIMRIARSLRRLATIERTVRSSKVFSVVANATRLFTLTLIPALKVRAKLNRRYASKRSQPTKALTGQRTPKQEHQDDHAQLLGRSIRSGT